VREAALHDELRDDLVLHSSDIPADRVLESKEAAVRLQAVLLELPDRSRDVFVLRVMEGLKMADVARALGISTRAAEKHQACPCACRRRFRGLAPSLRTCPDRRPPWHERMQAPAPRRRPLRHGTMPARSTPPPGAGQRRA
jgi:FixJ family two-component response regulator